MEIIFEAALTIRYLHSFCLIATEYLLKLNIALGVLGAD
jgi:hypothetical protein